MSTPKECGLLGRCFYAECHCKPAPVSATEPDAVRTLREGMRGQHALFNVNQEYVCAVAPLLEHIDALTARLAEAERVTEDSAIIDALAAREIEVECMGTTVPYWNVVVVKTGEMFTASPSLVQPTTLREALTRALTAARGGG